MILDFFCLLGLEDKGNREYTRVKLKLTWDQIWPVTYTCNIIMNFSLTYKSHFTKTEWLNTLAAVTWIIRESGEKENCLIFYSFLFVGSILIKHILWGTVFWPWKMKFWLVYKKQGIQNVSGTGSREGTLSCFVQTLTEFFVWGYNSPIINNKKE